MKRKMNKKGQLLGQLGLTFQELTFVGILGAIFLVVLVELRDDTVGKQAINSTGTFGVNQTFEALNGTILGIGNVFKQFPLFGTILGLLLIVGVVFLLVRGNGQRDAII
jgi:hypothetical protein